MTEAFLGTENKGKPNSETKFFKHSKNLESLNYPGHKICPCNPNSTKKQN